MPECESCPEDKRKNMTERGLKIHRTRIHPFEKKQDELVKHGDKTEEGYLDTSGLPHEISFTELPPRVPPGTLSVQGDLIPTEGGHIAVQHKVETEAKPGDVVIVGAGYRVVKPSRWERIKDFFRR